MHWQSRPDSLMGWVAPTIGDLTPVIAICFSFAAMLYPGVSSSPSLALPTCPSPCSLAVSSLPTSTTNHPVAGSLRTQILLLPCPQSIKGWGTLSVFVGPVCLAKVIGAPAPAPCCCSSSFDDAHCAMRRATLHRVFPTTRAVGTLKDGYARNVPLPRVPQKQNCITWLLTSYQLDSYAT